MSLSAALREVTARLADICDNPRMEAEWLMAHALGVTRSDMLMLLRDLEKPESFDSFLERRMSGEPLAHITGETEFWGLRLRVTPDVLIPRSDSELLIELAAKHSASPRHIADLGTGSGALLAAALTIFPEARGVGVDASRDALAVAESNAADLGLGDRARFLLADWNKPGWSEMIEAPFDLILCNPPYIVPGAEALAEEVRRAEPALALYGGADGLDAYRTLFAQLDELLAPDGLALFEIGYDQGESVPRLARDAGYDAEVHRDLSGQDRAVRLTRR